MTDQSERDPAIATVLSHRRQLTNVAYRLLGSLADAEDAVQEALIRWYALTPADRDAIESPAAWLTTVTSRICLDQLGSARARRERYVGEWIPEPVPDRTEWPGAPGDAADPADRITLDESIDMAFLVVLDSMSPAERVAFLLHDVFRYPFAEVAEIVGRTPAACRQLASTARRRVRDARPVQPPPARRAELVREFKRAWEAKDVNALLGLLDPDAVAVADGGGRVPAALEPREGAEAIASSFVELANRVAGLAFEERTVNGQPGLVGVQNGATVAVLAFDVADDRITRIWAVRNPDKLRPWNVG